MTPDTVTNVVTPLEVWSVGFTGTQEGMTALQKSTFSRIMQNCFIKETLSGDHSPINFHHGDCIGADAEASDLVSKECLVYIHPPDAFLKRAYRPAFYSYGPLPYLVRNRAIVDATQVLIATPKRQFEELRSGTWSTVRYARRLNKEIIIIWPDGKTTHENAKRPRIL
jgi:hypothetical protein